MLNLVITVKFIPKAKFFSNMVSMRYGTDIIRNEFIVVNFKGLFV